MHRAEGTRATATAVSILHFTQFKAGDSREQLPGLRRNAHAPHQMAGIMIGNGALYKKQLVNFAKFHKKIRKVVNICLEARPCPPAARYFSLLFQSR